MRAENKVKLMSIVFLMSLSLLVEAASQDTRTYELVRANKHLTATYKKILDKLASSEQIKLKKAQRAWMAFRDLDCVWAFGAEPIDCMINRTEYRTKELEQTDFFDIKGDYTAIESE